MKTPTKWTLFILILSPIITIHAQQKILLGLTGGISVYRNRVSSIDGDYFKSTPLFNLAPTGITLSIETSVKNSLEFGFCKQVYTNDYLGGSQDVTNFSFKWKRSKVLNAKWNILPFIGLNSFLMYQNSAYGNKYYIAETGTHSQNGIVTHDTLEMRNIFINGPNLSVELGAEMSYRISNRMYICANISYAFNPSYFNVQQAFYYKDGQNPSAAFIAYGGSGLFFQAGIKWHWRNSQSIGGN